MPRSYNGAGDTLRTVLGNCNFNLPATMVVIAQCTGRDAAWRNLFASLTSAGQVNGWSMELDLSNKLTFDTGTANQPAPTITAAVADGWVLLSSSKAAGGAAVCRHHRYKYSTNAWIHEDSFATASDGAGPGAGGFVELGGKYGTATDYFQGDLAVAGVWNRILTDPEIELLAFDLQAWFALAPNGLWLLDQVAVAQKVNDFVGGANETTITGTTVSTASVPVFSYGGHVARLLKATVATEFARPDADVSAGLWTPGTKWSQLDETVPDDTDFIQSSDSPQTTDVTEIGLGVITP